MTAPLVIEGATNGEIFLSYVEQCLAPALNHGVVMDNLPAHKVAGVEEAIEAVGAEVLYLPEYSPDLNPIEMSFSKLKAYLRKAAERTQRSLRRRIGLFNGLYKAEVIHRRGPWRSMEAVEYATLEWVDWFNNRRLLESVGNIPPAEAEAAYYAQIEELAMVA